MMQYLKRGYQFLYRHIVMILVSLLCLGIGIGLAGSYDLSMKIIETQAQQYAITNINTLNEARTLYSERVAQRVKDIDGVTLTPNYHQVDGAIPVPATFSIELSERLSQLSQNSSFRLYSDYPFPNRKQTGGPQDQFEKDALEALRKNPTVPFSRHEKIDNQRMFRYAASVRMESSCVTCHNSLPSSPKTDWKVGDVRGVIATTQPLDNVFFLVQRGLRRIYLVLVTLGSLAILGLVLVLGRLRLIKVELEKKVLDKTAALQRLATSDGLTKLANRYHFDQVLEQEWQRAQQHSTPLSLILCDVDFFKQFNDTYGHVEGDHCLQTIAQVFKNSAMRAGELAARYGGEEFVLLLPHLSATQAGGLARFIRSQFHTLQIPHQTSSAHPFITVSMGIATVSPKMESSEMLLQAADEALYQAKVQGRDRYVVWDSDASVI